jgi:UDP-N-acetylglucosamine:LPS N-acetylglucosamine transferase
MVRSGAARLVEDAAFDADALLEATAILDDVKVHHAMAAAVRALARPGAANAVAELVMAAAERRPLPEPATLEALSRGVAV